MRKFLMSPERLFAVLMWVLSLLFAGFLLSLGSKVIADLPTVEPGLTVDQFVDPARLARLQQIVRNEEANEPTLRNQTKAANAAVERAQTERNAALRSHEEWLRTRHVTAFNADGSKDEALVAATTRLQALSDAQLGAEQALNAAVDAERRAEQTKDEAERAISALRDDAEPRYAHAVRAQELKVFLWRLALTLPLLGVSWWLIATQRRSPRWPLARGFILFSAYAFFFELVPYLPSYGGYVRSIVGILLTLAAGHWGIRWMQRYLVRRREQEARHESERRAHLDNQQALSRMQADLCPACERSILTTGAAPADFCVHCGLRLFDQCGACSTRKNAFFNHCMACGTPAAAGRAGAPAPIGAAGDSLPGNAVLPSR